MKSISRYIYGPSPEEKVRAWQGKLRAEQRTLDREIRNLEMHTTKSRNELKVLAKKNDVKSAHAASASVVWVLIPSLQGNATDRRAVAMVKITGAFQKSTEIMKTTNQLVKLPQLSATMREMSMEMMKSGIMEEMMEETLDSVNEDDELEDEADAEVDKVLFELTDGKLGQAGAVGADLPAAKEDEEETEEEMQRMQREMADLLSG
ncbi:charged multivesicular body protein 3, partial [Tremellales sp. Uapishka_1]